MSKKSVRLQKYLAECGVASRRKAEKLIQDGEVMVNNQIVRELGTTVDPEQDEVKWLHKVVRPKMNKIYLMLNKPAGYLCTLSDPQDRRLVMDIIPAPLTLINVSQ